jgi:hypothetical protein
MVAPMMTRLPAAALARSPRPLWPGAAFALFALPLASAGAQLRDTTMALERGATVEVAGGSTDILVTTGTDRVVRVRGSDEARASVRATGRSLLVNAPGRRDGAEVALVVPRGTTLLLRTQSGDVSVVGTGADVEAETFSGDVRVETAARVRVETVSGDVTLRAVREGARVEVTSGDVRVDDLDGDLEVSATSGSVVLRGVASRRVAVQVVSGEVEWTGALADDGRYEFGAHSGGVRLALPRDARAALQVRTFSGELDAGPFPLTLLPEAAPRPRDREEQREMAEAREKLVALRDSLRRYASDSLRREQERQRSRAGDRASDRAGDRAAGTWERDFERSVEGLVESVMRGVAVGMESVLGAADQLADRGRGRRFTLGRADGPRVTLSSFSGTIRLRPMDGAAPRRE